MLKIFKNKNGFSMIDSLIAAGAMGAILTGMTVSTSQQIKLSTTANDTFSLTSLQNEIEYHLSDPTSCKSTIGSSPLNGVYQRGQSVTKSFAIGSLYGGNLKVTGYTLSPTLGPNQNSLRLLTLSLQRGSTALSLPIKLHVNTNASGVVTKCTTLMAMASENFVDNGNGSLAITGGISATTPDLSAIVCDASKEGSFTYNKNGSFAEGVGLYVCSGLTWKKVNTGATDGLCFPTNGTATETDHLKIRTVKSKQQLFVPAGGYYIKSGPCHFMGTWDDSDLAPPANRNVLVHYRVSFEGQGPTTAHTGCGAQIIVDSTGVTTHHLTGCAFGKAGGAWEPKSFEMTAAYTGDPSTWSYKFGLHKACINLAWNGGSLRNVLVEEYVTTFTLESSCKQPADNF